MTTINNDIKRLARSCASFTGSNGCLLEPNGQPRCSFHREDAQAAPFIKDGTMRCLYFEKSVLPADPALEARYFNREEVDTVKCERCGTPIVKKSNATKYCAKCGAIKRKQSEAERQRRNYRFCYFYIVISWVKTSLRDKIYE